MARPDPKAQPENPDAELTGLKNTLLPNYSNPFDNRTMNGFVIGETTVASLRVFNAVGTMIGVLHEGVATPGRYAFVFESKDLPDGLYYYVFTHGNTMEIRKMHLAR